MKVSLKNKIVIGFSAAIVILGGVGGASILNVAHIIARSSRTSESREAIAELNRLWGIVTATDAATRFYVLAATPESLRDYQEAKAELQASIEVLRQTTRCEALVNQRLKALEAAILARTTVDDEAVSLARAQRKGAAQALATSRTASDKTIRREIAGMMAQERDALTAQVTRTVVVWFYTMAGIVLTCLVAMIAMAWAAFLIRREMRERDLAQTKAREAAEQASQFKDQFLSTMSHELRTPLNAVIGFSELLVDKRYGPLNQRQTDYAGNIHAAGHHLLRLINDILDISKIAAGHLELIVEDLDLCLIAGDVLASLKPLSGKKSLNMSCACPAGLMVRADATRLQQVLVNLVGNAIKFTPEGGEIIVSAFQESGRVRIEVVDNGPGIPVDEQKLIFESFYRAKQSRWREGAGLGLTISRRLVEALGGEFGLESEPGKGSRFFFMLPPGKPAPAPVKELTEAGPHQETILVVENDEAAAQVIESQLVSEGYQVCRCEDARRTVELAAQMAVSAITLDVLMQPVSGWEVLAELKQNPATAAIPVILVTVLEQKQIGALLGADDYLVKPVEKNALLKSVGRCLSRSRRTGPLRVLIVDDDAAVRETLQALLENDYRVTTAADGAEALAAVAAELPSMVILDLLLPKVSGFELLAQWRADPCTASLPVLVLTSKDLSEVEEITLRSQANALFHKPGDGLQLLNVIEQHIHQSGVGIK